MADSTSQGIIERERFSSWLSLFGVAQLSFFIIGERRAPGVIGVQNRPRFG